MDFAENKENIVICLQIIQILTITRKLIEFLCKIYMSIELEIRNQHFTLLHKTKTMYSNLLFCWLEINYINSSHLYDNKIRLVCLRMHFMMKVITGLGIY